MTMMKLTFLGTGTSTGVPQIGCNCATCRSADMRDKRLRASALLQVGNTASFLIDSGPDLREQLLRAGAPDITALLVTHSHYDHVGGIDDLRPYCAKHPLPVYCLADVERDLRARIPYCFAKHLYPGVPTFDVHSIRPDEPFIVQGVKVTPLPVMHYKLPIIGFKIGQLAYITDCKTMPDTTLALLRGVDTLVINALRHKEHISHMSLPQALEVIAAVKPRRAYLTHLSHDMGTHAATEAQLPDNVRIAYDTLQITL